VSGEVQLKRGYSIKPQLPEVKDHCTLFYKTNEGEDKEFKIPILEG